MKLDVEIGAYVSFIRDVANEETHVAVNGKPICEADLIGERVSAETFVLEPCEICHDRVNPRAVKPKFGGFQSGGQIPAEFQGIAEAVQKAVEENLPDFAKQGGGFGFGVILDDGNEYEFDQE